MTVVEHLAPPGGMIVPATVTKTPEEINGDYISRASRSIKDARVLDEEIKLFHQQVQTAKARGTLTVDEAHKLRRRAFELMNGVEHHYQRYAHNTVAAIALAFQVGHETDRSTEMIARLVKCAKSVVPEQEVIPLSLLLTNPFLDPASDNLSEVAAAATQYSNTTGVIAQNVLLSLSSSAKSLT